MIDLTDLQEDILRLAVENPNMTNEEIADILDCSENWVGEVRRKYEHNVDESEVNYKLKTVSGTAANPPKNTNSGTESPDTDDILVGLLILVLVIAWANNQGLI